MNVRRRIDYEKYTKLLFKRDKPKIEFCSR